MNARALLFLAVAVPALAQAPAVPVAADPEPAAFSGMTAAHNSWRARAGVPALGWSDVLARQAQSWADTLGAEGCRTLRYDPDPQRRDQFGQNIMNSWTSKPYADYRKSPLEIVDRWGMDGTFFDAATNQCNAPSGRQCGQYVQLVWDETRFVGCGRSRCDTAEVWVCNYYPRGNRPERRPFGNPPASAVAPALAPAVQLDAPEPFEMHGAPMRATPMRDYPAAPVTPVK